MNNTWWVSESQLDPDQNKCIAHSIRKDHLITGSPGTGKTNLLVLKALQMRKSGMTNIRLLVFTRSLKEFIAAGVSQYGLNAEVQTFDGWMISFIREHSKKPDMRQDFNERTLARVNQCMDIAAAYGTGFYEALLIDEGQDCLDEQVRLFRSLAPVCYVAADHKQSIYRGVDGLKMWQQVINKENWSNLQFHYRNGKSICELADLVSIPADPANLLVPSMRYKEADLPSKVFAQPADSLDKQIDNLLTLLKQQLIAYPDEMLGVICPTHTVMQKVVPRLRSSGLTELCVFQRDVDGESYMRFSDQKRICVTTCHSAKGLEVRALHIVGADQFVAHPLRRNLVYTSITRAKTSLTIHYTNTLPDFLESALNQQNSGSTRQVDVKDLFGKENVD